MTVTFNLNYQTTWGQELHVSGSCKALGGFVDDKSIPMIYMGGGNWSLSVEFDEEQQFTYSYLLVRNGKVSRREYGSPRTFNPSAKVVSYKLYDHWHDMPEEKTFFSTPFTEVIYKHSAAGYKPKSYLKSLTIKVFAPLVMPNHRLGIVGKSAGLGSWSAEKAIPMQCPNFPEWEVCVDASKVSLPLEYKFVVLDEDGKVVLWEAGENRHAFLPPFVRGESVILSGQTFRNNLPRWRGAGVAIPVFSLRSNDSFGIGEFPDLKKMVDWAAQTGQRFVQILPINDTTITKTWVDTYPYKSISIFALHPIYLNLERVGTLSSDEEMARFRLLQKELNALDRVDYERVFNAKWEYFRMIYAQNGAETLASKEFKQFFEANKEWLVPYAAFCYLRDKFSTPDFTRWEEYASFDLSKIEKLSKKTAKSYNDIAICYYLQYHLHCQLLDAHAYAHEHGVAFKGDIPIGISRHSADAWTDFELFNMNGQAGAPPDDFSALGQNWGFPTYCWDKMEMDGYSWWKKRFKKMADYFDAYRIDHILGFFRIWEIPLHSVQGLLGYFNPALPYTRDEVQSFGLYFNDDRFLKPFIRKHFLADFFGEYSEEVERKFLADLGFGMFDLLPEFDTQRKVEAYFEGKTDKKSVRIREGLYGLINEVLFIRDPKQPHNFHPRITAQFSYSYRHLPEYEKAAFDRLYNHFYYERHTEFWKWEAMKKLPALVSATDMLVCGEDLGMIPDSVPDVMRWLQVLSLEIQRMPKDPKQVFGDTYSYPYSSVCTTSTHDMSTIRGWWEEDRAKTQQFYNHVMGEHGEAPYFCEPWICDRIVDQHLAAPSILCILPLQDWLSIDGEIRRKDPSEERINVPANPMHYWRYRMHLTLEELVSSKALNQRIKSKLAYFNR